MKTHLLYAAVATVLIATACSSKEAEADAGAAPMPVAEATDPAPAETPATTGMASEQGDIVDVAMASPDHSTLVAAVKAAGLVDTLKGAGPFTVFGPTNAAFDALPAGTVDTLLKPESKGDLTAVLTYHVVAGNVDAATLTQQITAGGGTAIRALGSPPAVLMMAMSASPWLSRSSASLSAACCRCTLTCG